MKNVVIILNVLLALSCSDSNNKVFSVKSPLPIIKVDLSTAQALDFKELFDSLSIIQFETNPKSLLGDIRTLELIGDDFYITHTADRYLHRYSISGEYLNRYGKIGRGPGEVYSTLVFSIDSSLLYFHVKNKIVAYNILNEELVIDKSVPFWASSFRKKNNDSWMFYRSRITTDSKIRYWETDDFFLNVKNYLHHDTSVVYGATWIKNIQKAGAEYYIYESGIDTIYQVFDDSVSASLTIDFGEYRLRPDFRKYSSLDDFGRIRMTSQEEFQSFVTPLQCIITRTNIWMYLWYMHKPYLLRYNKKYNETIIYDSVVGGPNIIKTGKLLNVHNNKMYWCISDNILLNLNKKEIEEYKMDELNRYRQSMPLNSNPFIMELEIKE